jgi:hypothetical protein
LWLRLVLRELVVVVGLMVVIVAAVVAMMWAMRLAAGL